METIHSALLLRTSRYGKEGEALASEKLNTLRSKLSNLQLIIINEVSMVGSNMLLNIHKRLSQLKGASDCLFGNVSVLAVGDLYQLLPVLQPNIYDSVRNPLANLHDSLWKDKFDIHELNKVMRQKMTKHLLTRRAYTTMLRTFLAFVVFMPWDIQQMTAIQLLCFLECLQFNGVRCSQMSNYLSPIKILSESYSDACPFKSEFEKSH